MITRIRQGLFEPVDASSIAAFRMLFGLIMLYEVFRYFYFGRIAPYYIDPQFQFTYYGFGWVRPWPGIGMYLHFIVVGIAAAGVALGCFYRFSAPLLFLGFGYVFLLEEARYLNHHYLCVLLAGLFAVIPAHRVYSVDAARGGEEPQTVPAWCLWLLRFQVGLVYFFAGAAKLNRDWLRGEPMRRWLARRDELPLIGPWLETGPAVWFVSYGGVLFDLLVVPFLLWRRTRVWAFALAVGFHLFNKWLFSIGIFPQMMIAATLIFFAPDWPRRWWFARKVEAPSPADRPANPRTRKVVVALLALYTAIQLFMPLRHWLYPGNVSWTEEGHRYAWRMKLREKRGEAIFLVTDPAAGRPREFPVEEHLDERQLARVGRWPDMVLQFAHYIARHEARNGRPDVQVRVICEAALNGRDYQYLVDPEVDLAREPRSLLPARWIVPLTDPVPEPPQPGP